MRELGKFDLDLIFLIRGGAGYASKSKYCKKYIETESIEDGYSYLLNNFKEEQYKPIIIISADDIISFLDHHREEAERYFVIPGCKIVGNTEKYTDKNTMTSLAQELGILCPESRFVNWDSDVRDIKYPCLIKPSHQRPGHYNEFKFKICKSEKALKRTLKYVHHDSVFILQEYIPKEKDLLVYGGRFPNGKTVIAGAFIRDRWADSGSSSHGIMTADIPKGADVSKIAEFLERIDYYGLFSFEYGMVGDKAYFFEVNLRNDGTSDYFNQAGANIPLAYVYSCAGKDYSEISTVVQNDAWFIDEVFDYENVIKRAISRKQWIKDKEKATIFKYYDKDDIEPYNMVYKTRYKQILQDFVLKKYRLYIVHIMNLLNIGK